MNKLQIITNGILKNNPTFVLVLGMCPTLGTTTSAINGMGMGVATMAVLIMSNLVISLIKNLIPDKVRIPAFIVVIASFVTIIQMLMQAYVPSLYASLGVFIPLIVVNCIILGRAEAYAYKNPVLPSLFDGLGMGMVRLIQYSMVSVLVWVLLWRLQLSVPYVRYWAVAQSSVTRWVLPTICLWYLFWHLEHSLFWVT